MRRYILSFMCVMMCFGYAFTQQYTFSSDTISLRTNTGSYYSSKQIDSLLLAKDFRIIAESFYRTAQHLTQSYPNSIDSLHTAQLYFTHASEYFSLANMPTEQALSIEQKASVAFHLGKSMQAIQLSQKAIEIYSGIEPQDYSHIATLHTNIGFLFLNMFRYENALRFFNNALNIGFLSQDYELLSKSLYYKGLVFYEQEQYDSTLSYYSRALEYDIILNNTNEIIASYNNIAVVLLKQKKYSEALEMLSNADEYVAQSSGEVKAIHANNIGNALFYAQDYTSALEQYRISIETKNDVKNNESIAVTLHNIARLYAQTNILDSAVVYIERALELIKTDTRNELQAEICRTASSIFEQKQQFQQALEFYECFIASSFSIVTEESDQISEDLLKYQEGRFQAASIQREIRMQQLLASYDFAIKRAEIQTKEEERKTQQLFIYIIIGVLVFIILALVIIINQYLLKKKASKKLEEQNAEIERQNEIIFRQTEELLLSNREFEKLSIVASNTDNAIIIMNSNGDFEWVNDAFTRIFGFTFEELCENISPNIISETTPDYVTQQVDACVTNKQTVNYDLLTKNKEGDDVWVNVTLTPILDEHGNVSRLVMIDSDISGLKKAEREIQAQKTQIENQKEELTQQRDEILLQSEELEKQKQKLSETLEQLTLAQSKLVESEKMAALGGLVAGISHEINTPVGVGSTAATSLLSQTNQLYDLFSTKKMKLSDLQSFLETAQQACDLILKNLHRTADLVKSFNKVSVDNMSEQKRAFNLAEYIEDIHRSLAPKLKGRPVSLSIDCPADIELVSFPGAFAQVFTNLIINSLTHAFDEADEGTISIRISKEDSILRMVYADNGKGIPEENQSKIFDAFFTTNSEVGTGLGMNITYNIIVQKLGGEISLQSSQGNGVVFTIEIPFENLTE